MANISSLAVQMVAKTGGFVSGMDAAGRSVEKFSRRAQKSLAKQKSAALLADMQRQAGVGDSFEMLGARAVWAAADAEKRRQAATAATVEKLKLAQAAQKGWFRTAIGGAGSVMRGLGGIGSAIAGATMRAAKWVGISALAFGAALVYKIKSAAEEIDNLAKSADRLGSSTEGLGAIKFAAMFSGVEGATVQTGLEKMLDTISDAGSGLKMAQKPFSDLGLDIAALQQMKPEQQFLAISRSLVGVANSADRVRIARDIFGRGGAPMLNIDAGEVIQAAQQMERLGLSVSRFDAAKVEEANDAFDLVKTAVTGLFTQIAIKLAPAITDLSTRFTDWAMNGGGMTVKVAEALDWLGNAFLTVGHIAQTVFKGIKVVVLGVVYGLVKGFTEAFIKFDEGVVFFQKQANKLREAIGLNPIYSTETMLPVDEMRAFADSFGADMSAAADDFNKHLLTPPDQSTFATGLKSWWAGVQEQADLRAEIKLNAPKDITDIADTDLMETMRKDAESLVKETRTPFETFRDEVKNIQDLYQNGLIDQTTYNRGIAQAAEKFGKAGGDAKSARKEIDALNKALDPGSFASDATGLALRGRKEGVRGPMSIRDMVKSKPATDAASGVTGNGANTQQMIALLQQLVLQGQKPTELMA